MTIELSLVVKNLLKKVVEEGGVRKVYMVLRGGQLIVHVSPQGGGGSKKLENWSTWFMNEPLYKYLPASWLVGHKIEKCSYFGVDCHTLIAANCDPDHSHSATCQRVLLIQLHPHQILYNGPEMLSFL